jgi:flagellar biosynthetic protein FliR
VVTRAAPQLNLFGIGFPITMLAGFLALYLGLDSLMMGMSTLFDAALSTVADVIGSGSGAH